MRPLEGLKLGDPTSLGDQVNGVAFVCACPVEPKSSLGPLQLYLEAVPAVPGDAADPPMAAAVGLPVREELPAELFYTRG